MRLLRVVRRLVGSSLLLKLHVLLLLLLLVLEFGETVPGRSNLRLVAGELRLNWLLAEHLLGRVPWGRRGAGAERGG